MTGDGGLRKFVTKNGNHAAGPSQLIRAMKTGGEHTAHALKRGPDGWLYLLCGNNANIDASYAQLPTSPVKKPVAGCVLRFTPDLKKSEIVAHGYRNPYGMDFNQDGELFTFDSDNERCVSLPWYEPTRFYHVLPGGFYGWLNPQHDQFWRFIRRGLSMSSRRRSRWAVARRPAWRVIGMCHFRRNIAAACSRQIGPSAKSSSWN